MADDLTDAKATLQRIQGLENHPYGVVLARAVRLLEGAAVRLKQLEDRVAALEAK
jgi:hypothetical protein